MNVILSSTDEVALCALSQGRTKTLKTASSTGLTETSRWVRIVEVYRTGGKTLVVEVEIVD